MASKNITNFLPVAQAFIDVFNIGPYYDHWYSDEDELVIVRDSHDIITIIPPSSIALTIFNKGVSKSPLFVDIETKSGGEKGMYCMRFSFIMN
jgi:hypothetical protein